MDIYYRSGSQHFLSREPLQLHPHVLLSLYFFIESRFNDNLKKTVFFIYLQTNE